MEFFTAQADALSELGYRPIAVGILGLAALWTIVNYVVTWAKLRHVPGPFLASFSYLWGLRSMHSGRIHDIIQREQAKHGRVMRIGPDAVCIYEPEPLWRMNSARSSYTRGIWYKAIKLDHRGDNIINELDTPTHDRRKAKLAAGYAGRGLLNLEANVDAGIAELVRHVRAKVARGDGKMDLGRLLQFFQVDLITKAGMGISWNDLANETDHYDYLKLTDQTVAFAHPVAWSPATIAIFSSKFFLRLFGAKTTDKHGLGEFFRYAERRLSIEGQDRAKLTSPCCVAFSRIASTASWPKKAKGTPCSFVHMHMPLGWNEQANHYFRTSGSNMAYHPRNASSIWHSKSPPAQRHRSPALEGSCYFCLRRHRSTPV